MNTINIVNLINNATGNSSKTKELLLRCKHTVLNKDKLIVKHIIEDINKFIKTLPHTQSIKIASDINALNLNCINSETLLDNIDIVLDSVLGNDLIKLRVSYDVNNILDWMETDKGKTYGRDSFEESATNGRDSLNILRKKVNVYLKTSSDDTTTIYQTLDDIFEQYLGNTYEYYSIMYQNYIKKLINTQFNQYNRLNFKIVDKYGVNEDISNAALKIRNKYNVVEDKVINPRFVISDEKLQKIQNIIHGGIDTQLKNDMDILDNIGNKITTDKGLWDIKNAWKDIYVFLTQERIKPGKKRIAMCVILIYLVLENTSIEQLIKITQNMGYTVPPIDKTYTWFVRLFGKGILHQYKDKFYKLMNPTLDIKNLIIYFNNNNLHSNEIINEIYKEWDKVQQPSLHKQFDIIYNVIKKHNIKITRKKLKDIIG